MHRTAPGPDPAQSETEATASTEDTETCNGQTTTATEALRRQRAMDVLAKRHLTDLGKHWAAYEED